LNPKAIVNAQSPGWGMRIRAILLLSGVPADAMDLTPETWWNVVETQLSINIKGKTQDKVDAYLRDGESLIRLITAYAVSLGLQLESPEIRYSGSDHVFKYSFQILNDNPGNRPQSITLITGIGSGASGSEKAGRFLVEIGGFISKTIDLSSLLFKSGCVAFNIN